ncbi:MAG: hypothetical protein ABI914_02920 [Acidobacteriota bacterium]
MQFLLASALAVAAILQSFDRLELFVESAPNEANARIWVLARREGAPEKVSLARGVLLDASAIAAADVERGPGGYSQIRLSLTPEGARRLAEITRRFVGRRLGIVVEGRLRSAPRVMERVSNGILVIAGDFSDSEAQEMARKLRPPAGLR